MYLHIRKSILPYTCASDPNLTLLLNPIWQSYKETYELKKNNRINPRARQASSLREKQPHLSEQKDNAAETKLREGGSIDKDLSQ